MKRTLTVSVAIAVLLGALAWWVTRPAPRQDTPLRLDGTGVERETVVRDRRGRPIIVNFRAVEPARLYRGSAFPTSFAAAGGEREYADDTAFALLRSLNVRHVVALLPDAQAFYAEEGYLRYWSERTGHVIGATWVPIDPATPYSRDDRGGLHAAGILIALMREDAGRGGAVYVHDEHGVAHAGIAVAGYELWRNRGWMPFDEAWARVEARFLAANDTMRDAPRGGMEPVLCPSGRRAFACAEPLRELRELLRFVIEL